MLQWTAAAVSTFLGVSTAETGRWVPAGKRVGAEQERKEAVELSAAAVHCPLLHLAGQQGRADVPSAACTRVVRLEAEEKMTARGCIHSATQGSSEMHG